MSAIRIRKHLDSDTLHLPEVRSMIGRDVEIIVSDTPAASTPERASEFWNPPTLEELARRQGFRGPLSTKEAFGSLSDADWQGFDEWLEEQSKPPREPKDE